GSGDEIPGVRQPPASGHRRVGVVGHGTVSRRAPPRLERIALEWNRGAIQERVHPLGQTEQSVFSQHTL
ncbi:MAG: hypothetical protein ACREFU_06955, partial [Acetobacteraceae bacterium]